MLYGAQRTAAKKQAAKKELDMFCFLNVSPPGGDLQFSHNSKKGIGALKRRYLEASNAFIEQA